MRFTAEVDINLQDLVAQIIEQADTTDDILAFILEFDRQMDDGPFTCRLAEHFIKEGISWGARML